MAKKKQEGLSRRRLHQMTGAALSQAGVGPGHFFGSPNVHAAANKKR